MRSLGWFLPVPFVLALVVSVPSLRAQEEIRLASTPALSPDGKRLAFSWNGDLWLAPSGGGAARRLTVHPARDHHPAFSPDGKRLAFLSARSGVDQVYVMPVAGGPPRQVTFHSEGVQQVSWFPDGEHLLILARRDHFWRRGERFFRIHAQRRQAEQLLFDDYGHDGQVGPQGRRLLFVREGESWWRKGYYGSRAAQVWLFDLEKHRFRRVLAHPRGCSWPLWHPEGKGFYYVGAQDGTGNLWFYDLETGKTKQLTHYKDDPVVFPAISADGSTIVFRRLFDLYRFRPGKDRQPRRLRLVPRSDDPRPQTLRRKLTQAQEVAFTADGLQVAFVAGGDVWVMDTVLREPRQVTATPEEESDVVFAPDGKSLYFISWQGGQSDVWKATRADEKRPWWRNTQFKLQRLTNDRETESQLRVSPKGTWLSYVRSRGDLYIMRPDGTGARRVVASWNSPQYDWSPDEKWLVYAVSDNNFNRDVWLLELKPGARPVNISRHPDNESSPVWSPNGRMIAFLGQRFIDEVDIHLVYLRQEDYDRDAHQRRLEQALKKMGTSRTGSSSSGVKVDLKDIHRRVQRVSIANTSESNLFWSPDGRRLAFTATINGRRGTYVIAPPESLKPQLLTSTTGTHARWLAKGNQIVWLVGGVPSALAARPGASNTAYRFTVYQQVDPQARYLAGFTQCWQVMRDYFYDEALNNRNWDAIFRKYAPVARQAVDNYMFAQVVHLMLGELNASHLGFRPNSLYPTGSGQAWQETTAHLGLRFDPQYKGPGLRVRDVIRRSPADRLHSRVLPGEIVLSIDGQAVDPAMDLTAVLNGPLARDVVLGVKNAQGKTRRVVLRPISYAQARGLLYRQWVEQNRQQVEKLSGGKLGYLHVQAMNMSSFWQFQADLYAAGAGKQGLIIDVRENGGGFTTDHLLTALTQPVHALTVPRGGGPGYPQDRKVYATWNKPILVLCNQNSFSNAEIFTHAIQTLKRGRVVGVPTAGGVISTGSTTIMDLGRMRVPFRGWFVLRNGEDMELGPAWPDVVVWPEPEQLPRGKDVQLEKGVQLLLEDVKRWQQRPRPKLKKASQRPPDAWKRFEKLYRP